MILTSLSFVCSVKFVLSIEITQNYIIIFLKIMWRKETSGISQFFTRKHKINESNAKIPTHYWIVCLYSKNVSYYVFIPNKFFNFFRNMFNTETIEINSFISVTFLLQNKAVHCVPTSAYSPSFITYAPSFIVWGKLFVEKTPLNLGSFCQCLCISKFVKGWGGSKKDQLLKQQL